MLAYQNQSRCYLTGTRVATIWLTGLAITILLSMGPNSHASDWMRFRGPNGTGINNTSEPPTKWSDSENIKWQVELPGPGSSSPILVGDKLFITCWTGYGENKAGEPGDQADLARRLICIDRADGKTLWSKSVKAELPEDEYSGMLTQHGYASHTPVSDGQNIYAYFGKSGVIAFDLEGNELWQVDCGDGFGAKDWGSAASPFLHNDLLIVSAFAEDNALIALDKEDGKEVWRYELEGLDGVWGTPVIATSAEGRTDLVLAGPFKMIGLDPTTGIERWTSIGLDNDTVSTSPLAVDDVVYVLAGRGGSIAVRVGGDGDVTDTHVLWRGSHRGGIPTPVAHEERIYWIGRSGLSCIEASTGDSVFQSRFTSDAATRNADPAEGGEGRRARFKNMPYASPIVVGDKFYCINRSGEAFVVRLGEEFEQLENNLLSDGGDFSGTPAVGENELYIRSSKSLYCIAKPE